jgi:hypothetical protein
MREEEQLLRGAIATGDVTDWYDEIHARRR